MYIARRTGGGRGVYEIAGSTASGLTSSDLLDREIVFEIRPDFVLPSGVVLHVQGGKHRLSMETAEIQIQRQLAAALMLPSPRRADAGLGTSDEIARTKEYAIERIQLEFVNAIEADKAKIVPDDIELINSSGSQILSVQKRFDQLAGVWSKSAELPEPLKSLVLEHSELVTAGKPISSRCERVVADIQKAAADAWPQEAHVVGDPLAALTAHLSVPGDSLPVQDVPTMDTAVFAFQGGFDPTAVQGVPERARRAIIQRRGQQSFRRALLSAYGGRCQVTEYTGEPALEAAHIWPYSQGGEYTNDPRNGLLLRADIHVLFDLGLVRIAPESLEVRVMPQLEESSYAPLEGVVLKTADALEPSREALALKWGIDEGN